MELVSLGASRHGSDYTINSLSRENNGLGARGERGTSTPRRRAGPGCFPACRGLCPNTAFQHEFGQVVACLQLMKAPGDTPASGQQTQLCCRNCAQRGSQELAGTPCPRCDFSLSVLRTEGFSGIWHTQKRKLSSPDSPVNAARMQICGAAHGDGEA